MMLSIFNNAPTYMTVFTVYIFFLPFFFLLSIFLAKRKKIKLHFISQTFLLGLTLLFVLYFEIMIRIYGGFLDFANDSFVPYPFLLGFLIFHIILASISLGGWIYLYISSLKAINKKSPNSFNKIKHKKIGISIFIALTVSSITGLFIYIFLFFRY
ncbi:DUF420 domain-containing protein [Arcobacter sp. LA11]|uniref:DUF420 domain-containing protein n=1 Tax=Arcobacter sp. LA11 TaxID=1898176 RepID=UPI0009329937|nr:DUF420 domain-containing protein [Arcobacter sp. LA11]